MRSWIFVGLILSKLVTQSAVGEDAKVFRAGARAVDISPTEFPVIINGMFTERTASKVIDPVMARAIVLDDGQTKIAIVVLDSCGIIREVADPIKELACKATGIPTDRILISATHTHSAPSVWPALGSRIDPKYVAFMTPLVARAIQLANDRLEPAQVGFTSTHAPDYTHCRRWIRRSDRMLEDPFGVKNVHAHMHPGFQSPDAIAPSGPVDDELSIVSFQSLAGKPLAVLCNFSMHYVGSTPISADYFGKFDDHLARRLKTSDEDPPCMVAMSQGTAGDQHQVDYSKPEYALDYDRYGDDLAAVAEKAYRTIEYQQWVPIQMQETRLTLDRRVPDAARWEAAQKVFAKVNAENRLPANIPEIYAFEQQYLYDEPKRELKVQDIAIGELAILTWPNEVFGITGLKVKRQSPYALTFNITQANGADGYIPPPEQHKLGGYTTWPARSAGLVPEAEPTLVELHLKTLEKLSGKPRRPLVDTNGDYAKAVIAAKPAAYWRLEAMAGQQVADSSGNGVTAQLEDGVALYLEGPARDGFSGKGVVNRAVHFAGGRLTAKVLVPVDRYSVEFWLWNGFPNDTRALTGSLFSRGTDEQAGDQLAIGGNLSDPGKLVFFGGNPIHQALSSQSPIEPKTWNHVALVRDGNQVRLYLNGKVEAAQTVEQLGSGTASRWYFGGRHDNQIGLEGKLDEVAIYDRALTPNEIADHMQKSSP